MKSKAIAKSTVLMWFMGLSLLLIGAAALADDHGDEETTWDGLVQIDSSNLYSAFIDPNADFSGFKRVSVLRPHVAFRSNWERDANRATRGRNIRASDIERIKNDVADQFISVFEESLEAAGYEIVNYGDEDVLVVRPAIIDLDITAPDLRGSGRTRTYVAQSGAATLFVELRDSLTGDLLGRAVDRQGARRGTGFTIQANRVTNRADARRIFRGWADILVEFLDAHYVKPSSNDDEDE